MCCGEWIRSVQLYLRRKRRQRKRFTARKRSTLDSFNTHYQLDIQSEGELGRSYTNIFPGIHRPVPPFVTEMAMVYMAFILLYFAYVWFVIETPPPHSHMETREHGYREFIQDANVRCRNMRVVILAPPATQYDGLLQWLRTNPFYPLVNFEHISVVDDLCAILCRPETIQSNLTFFVLPTDPIERMIRHIQQYHIDTDYALKDIDEDLTCILDDGGHHPPPSPEEGWALNFTECTNNYCYFKHVRPTVKRRHYLLVWGMAPHLYRYFTQKKHPAMMSINYREGARLDKKSLARRLYQLVDECLPDGVPIDFYISEASDIQTSEPSNIEDSTQALETLGIPETLESYLQEFYSIHAS